MLEYYQKGLRLAEEMQNKEEMANSLYQISDLYFLQGKSSEALKVANKSLSLGKELGYPEKIKNVSLLLSKIYEANGNFEKARENYEVYVQMRDSLTNVDNRKASIKSQLKYEYEKQAAADSIAHAKESDIKNAELKKHQSELAAKKNQQYVMFGGLALIIVFAAFMYNRFRVTSRQKTIIEAKEREAKKQNEIILGQKHLVEEKQKEILDSINYAKRIQVALITSEKYIEKNLNRLKTK
ncbi:MAG: protein serine/threonine phosphatase [Bacteroidetes bacterium]|nr:protein serine/threonine phosphatase [Bacteroidota bacterium]